VCTPEEAELAANIPVRPSDFVARAEIGSRFLRAALTRVQDPTGA